MGHLLLPGYLRYYPRYEGSPARCGPAWTGARSRRGPRQNRPIFWCERTRDRVDCVLLGM